MGLWVVFACLVASCLAQKPEPCASPPLMSGELTLSTQSERLWIYAKYVYDAIGQRIRLQEIGTMDNKTFSSDLLLLFKEGVMYTINDLNSTCEKSLFKGDFHPMEIPKTATLLGQAVLGSSSAPGQGLLVNTWTGELPKKAGKYMATVTEIGCIPVTTFYHTEQAGWMMASLFNNIIGILDPSKLIPPSFCPNAQMKASGEEEPADLFSVFLNKH